MNHRASQQISSTLKDDPEYQSSTCSYDYGAGNTCYDVLTTRLFETDSDVPYTKGKSLKHDGPG